MFYILMKFLQPYCNDKTNDIVYFPTLPYFESVPSFYSLIPHERVSIKRRGRQSREKGT